MFNKKFSILFIISFFLQSLAIDLPLAQASSTFYSLPPSNQMISLSAPLQPIMLQGLRYNPQQPFQFEFILQQGDQPLPLDKLRDQGMDLVRYFMAAMTMPEDQLWVNLSPYEKERIIPNDLSVTRLGSNMLVQDYVLKQLASSLTFPDSEAGKAFWKKIYSETQDRFGTTNIPISTFNKVWIIPDYAEVLVKENTVVVTDSHLKVMMEQDYLAQKKNIKTNNRQNLASDVMRQIIIPILEKEVNSGSHFASLRQMFHAVVLAEWYKRNFKESLFNQFYANKHKMAGIDEIDRRNTETIYKRYLSAYKKGVYNFIREDAVPGTNQTIPRKYFSGGENLDVRGKIQVKYDLAQVSKQGKESLEKRNAYLLKVGALAGNIDTTRADKAMNVSEAPKTAADFLRIKKIKFLTEMQNRWLSQDDDPQDVKQLIDELRSKNESTWVNWEDIETSFGVFKVLMVRVRHHGKITRGGVRVVSAWDGEDIQTLFNQFESYNPTDEERRELDRMIGVQTATALAMGMTGKNEAVNLGVGGAKGLIYIPQSKKLTAEQFEELKNAAFYWYGYRLTEQHLIGADIDGLAPDQNSGAKQMLMATEGHLAALLNQGEDAFEWKNGYMDVIQGEDRDFVPPVKGRYKDLFEELSRIKKAEYIDEHPQLFPLAKTPLKDAYDAYGMANPGLPMPANATFTGKPIKQGGIDGREEATGNGAVEVAAYYYELLGDTIVGKTAAVQGAGNVGINTAFTLLDKGAILQYLADLGATLYKKGGLDYGFLEELKKLLKKNRLKTLITDNKIFFEKYGVEILPEDSIFDAEVDALFPAATQNVITKANWKRINAKIIVEAANDPVDSEAERLLHDKETPIEIIPDSLDNPGGVTVSKFEQIQALLGKKLSAGYVLSRMHIKLRQALKKNFDLWRKMKQTGYPKATLRDAVKLEVVKGLARKQMIKWIDRNNGEINEIIENEYHIVISDSQFEDRLKELDLLDYLHDIQLQDLENIRSKILRILVATDLSENASDLEGIHHWINLLLPTNNPKSPDFNMTLALARTVLRIIDGNGEKLTSSKNRLTSLGYNLQRTRALRRLILRKLKSQHFPDIGIADTLNNRIYNYLRDHMILLDDDTSLGQEALEKLYPKAGDDNAMLTSEQRSGNPLVDGGIDFDTSHMLINQEGETAFQDQAMSSGGAELQSIKGVRPIFLSLQPVNISALMGK